MKQYSPEQIKFLIIRTIGNFFVLAALLGMFLTFGPAVKSEIVYRFNQVKGIKYVVSETSQFDTSGSAPQTSFADLPKENSNLIALTPVDTDFGIIIPKIAANSVVIPNVDPSNKEAYLAALKEGVAHALGTLYPGNGGNIYLFAHSTDNFWNVGRYNAVFYLLKELEPGDEVDLFFQGRRYVYTVEKKEIVDPEEVSYLTEPTSSEQLTLQTCWPPGTTFKRLIVIAKPVINFHQSN